VVVFRTSSLLQIKEKKKKKRKKRKKKKKKELVSFSFPPSLVSHGDALLQCQ